MVLVVGRSPGAAPAASGSRFLFADVADRVGIGHWTRTWGSAWNDYDFDGDTDFFLGRHASVPWLFRFEDGAFDRVQVPDLEPFVDRHQCTWGEANGDGDPDLYCVQGADLGFGTGPNQLFIQTSNGFQNRAFRFKVRDRFGRGRTANWLDYDGDGDLDIFVGNANRTFSFATLPKVSTECVPEWPTS
jgi:FG-GAP-like repeat